MRRNSDETTVIRAVNPLLESLDDDEEAYLVVLSGRSIGHMVRAAGTVTIGRHPSNDVVIDDDGVSRYHAEVVTDAHRVSRIRDLGSTNGTFVELERVGRGLHRLTDGDRIRIGPATILKYGVRDTVEQQFLSRLYRAATRDGLTGCFKREYFFENLQGEVAWHRRNDEWLAVLLIDLDHFKRINDTHGHQAGDRVLREFAGILQRECREEDLVARYGGEEFAVVLRRTTAEEGRVLAERLRAAVAEHRFEHGGARLAVTVSVGVLARKGADLGAPRDLVRDADRLMYAAKAQGGNAVACGG